MKIYVLASFKMEHGEKSIKPLIDWLNAGLNQFAGGDHFLSVTSSTTSFLIDARRLVKGDPAPTFNASFSKGHPKRLKK